MHPNAEITFRLNETANALNVLLGMQPKEGGSIKGGQTREEIVKAKAMSMLSKLPSDFDMKVDVKKRLKDLWKQAASEGKSDAKDKGKDQAQISGPRPPLNIFLEQELQRVQKVLSLVRNTLQDLSDAIAGTVIMTEHLQDALDAIYDARVPKKWLAISWDLFALGSWVISLNQRIAQYQDWLKVSEAKDNKSGELPGFWLTGFFNPAGFLTSVKQKLSRYNQWALDKVEIVTSVLQ